MKKGGIDQVVKKFDFLIKQNFDKAFCLFLLAEKEIKIVSFTENMSVITEMLLIDIKKFIFHSHWRRIT